MFPLLAERAFCRRSLQAVFWQSGIKVPKGRHNLEPVIDLVAEI